MWGDREYFWNRLIFNTVGNTTRDWQTIDRFDMLDLIDRY